MRRLGPWLALVFLLGGCSYAWVRPDATPAQVRADEQRCRAETANLVQPVWSDAALGWGPMYRPWGPAWYGGPGWYGWWPDPSAELAAEQRAYDRCMRTKGYNLVRVDRKTGEPRY
jgi:hypothetical protein